MSDVIEKLKGWLNLGVIPLLGILLFTSFFIFLPLESLTKLGLVDLKAKYNTYFGLGFVFSLTFLIAAAINGFWKVYLGRQLKKMAAVHFYKKEAHDLTNEEKEILNIFIKGKTRSTSLSMKNGVVLGLEKRMFIIRVGQLGNDPVNWSFPFNIQPWAWEYLNKKPHLLKPEN
ncbi:MAG: superinfection exclusion B family protein [Gammaproteobacteria bacterium]|nr:superinfection exclusion B family protein [Gammaproteobacteria bacterium]MCF6261075.1 superinfection exclusion B family protein [Gammaproteobacteria bacterium]